MTADHTHTGRNSLIVMVQGTLTEARGDVRHDYKPGDVIAVAEGVTHHAENRGTVPVIYVMHKTPEGWKAWDVKIEGISYVKSFRDDFAE